MRTMRWSYGLEFSLSLELSEQKDELTTVFMLGDPRKITNQSRNCHDNKISLSQILLCLKKR